MADYFEPYRSEYAEVSKFRRSVKREGETVGEFLSRLRETANFCRFDKFKNLTEKEIEWQFVIGCRMPELEKRMVEKNEWTLKQVIDLATQIERQKANLEGLRSRESIETSLNGLNFVSNAKSNRTCMRCGYQAIKDKETCSALDKECRTCGKTGHYSKVCMSGKK